MDYHHHHLLPFFFPTLSIHVIISLVYGIFYLPHNALFLAFYVYKWTKKGSQKDGENNIINCINIYNVSGRERGGAMRGGR